MKDPIAKRLRTLFCDRVLTPAFSSSFSPEQMSVVDVDAAVDCGLQPAQRSVCTAWEEIELDRKVLCVSMRGNWPLENISALHKKSQKLFVSRH